MAIIYHHRTAIHSSHNLRGLVDYGRKARGIHTIYANLLACADGRWPVAILYGDGCIGTDVFESAAVRKYWCAQRAVRSSRYITTTDEPLPAIARSLRAILYPGRGDNMNVTLTTD